MTDESLYLLYTVSQRPDTDFTTLRCTEENNSRLKKKQKFTTSTVVIKSESYLIWKSNFELQITSQRNFITN